MYIKTLANDIFRKHPLLSRFVCFIVLPLTGILGVSIALYTANLPSRTGLMQVPGLRGEVRVFVDSAGIPQIQAENDHDAYLMLGYLHAQDRIWQLELQRRISTGNLSQIFGARTIDVDKLHRTLGLQQIAERNLATLSGETREILQTYANGINAWINQTKSLPPEFHFSGIKPKAWSVVDSIVLMKFFALVSSDSLKGEMERLLLVRQLPENMLNDLFPEFDLAQLEGVATTKKILGVEDNSIFALINEKLKLSELGWFGLQGSALVSIGDKPEGNPKSFTIENKLALGSRHANVFYLANINGKHLHVAGITIPGLPFVLSGRNEFVAWGIADAGLDTVDTFVERVSPYNLDVYDVDGEPRVMETGIETINIKAEFPSILRNAIPPLEWRVRKTIHGPVISDIVAQAQAPVAMSWVGFEADDQSIQAFIDINYARNWEEFRRACENLLAPTLAVAYADVNNNFGALIAGALPRRQAASGLLPVPGWQSTQQWKGYTAAASEFVSFNPPKEKIEIAKELVPDNADVVASEYFLQSVLKTRPGVTSARDIMESKVVEELVAVLRQAKPENERSREALSLLTQANKSFNLDAPASAVFHVWLLQIQEALFTRALGERWQQFAGSYARHADLGFLKRALTEENSSWCQADCSQILSQTLSSTVDDLVDVAGSNPEKWRWDELSSSEFINPLFDNVNVIRRLFNRKVSGIDGFNSWLSTYESGNGFVQTTTSRYSYKLDIADQSFKVAMTMGQSENILSKFYDNLLDAYRDGRLTNMVFYPNVNDTSSMIAIPRTGK